MENDESCTFGSRGNMILFFLCAVRCGTPGQFLLAGVTAVLVFKDFNELLLVFFYHSGLRLT
jgi:hypothetical protein